MDWVTEIDYFQINLAENQLTFIPKELILDIYFDKTENIIPYSNGKCYTVYQDLTFKIVEFIEKYYTDLTVKLNNQDKIPSIIITGNNINDSIIKNINKVITKYINSKFSLFIDESV